MPDGRLLSNRQIATRTGLPRSTLSRLTSTLTKTGYLSYDAASERYCLGVGVLPDAEAFARGMGMVYVMLRRTVSRVMLAQRVGNCLPIATISLGHAWLHILTHARLDARARLAPLGLGQHHRQPRIGVGTEPLVPRQPPAIAVVARGGIDGAHIGSRQ
jgi:DNA-binding IclR family transcriptional regulator